MRTNNMHMKKTNKVDGRRAKYGWEGMRVGDAIPVPHRTYKYLAQNYWARRGEERLHRTTLIEGVLHLVRET